MTALLADGARVTTSIFPDISLRKWRAMDAAGLVPRAVKVGRRKLWRVDDLVLWTELGCPSRRDFEARQSTRALLASG